MAETINEIKDKILGTVHTIGRKYAEGQSSDVAERRLGGQLDRLVHRAQIEERKSR